MAVSKLQKGLLLKQKDRTLPCSTSASSVGIDDSHFLLLYSCLQMIMKTPQVLILGLQIHFTE